MSIVYGPLGTAIEQVHVGDANAEQALAGANDPCQFTFGAILC